jgi:hypothetical protein
MAVIEKRSGRNGIRWRVSISKCNYSPLTQTFSYKADAEAWARETERSLETGTYNTTPAYETLVDLIKRYANEVSIKKRGAVPERIRLFKIARHTIAKIRIKQLKSAHFAQYRDQRLNEVTPSTLKWNLVFSVMSLRRLEGSGVIILHRIP